MVQSDEIKTEKPMQGDLCRRPGAPSKMVYEARLQGITHFFFHEIEKREAKVQWNISPKKSRIFLIRKIHQFYRQIIADKFPATYEPPSDGFGVELGGSSQYEKVSLEQFLKTPRIIREHPYFESFQVMNMYTPHGRVVLEPHRKNSGRSHPGGNIKVLSRQDLSAPLAPLLAATSLYDPAVPPLEDLLRSAYQTVFRRT